MHVNSEKRVNNESASKAGSFLKSVSNFQFIVALVITRKVFQLSVTELLQNKCLDLYNGISLITALKNLVRSVLNSVDEQHEKWYSKALELAELVDVSEERPRICSRQVHRMNVNTDTVSQYFKITITQPLLQFLDNELSSRFGNSESADPLIPYYGLSIIPSSIFSPRRIRPDW